MKLVHADAATLLDHVSPKSAMLAYLDPPFAVGAQFGAREGRGHRAGGTVAYDDRWPSLAAYLAWLEARLAVVREALSPRGTMWLHLDQRAVHEAKAICDRLFGRAAFLGEIVWVPGNGAKGRRGPGMSHQTLLLYAKDPAGEWVWNAKDPALRESFAPTSLSMHFKKQDDEGRRYRDRTIGGKTYRYYADEGRALGSVWTDCPAMHCNTPLRAETTGYPTQKPLKLLDRIVRASTVPGGLVVDPFCGSGTTLLAAATLARPFVGMDVGALAIRTTSKRLTEAAVPFGLLRPRAKHAREATRGGGSAAKRQRGPATAPQG
jgi:site-specific DNA-methyltransferase (adenine-specific)